MFVDNHEVRQQAKGQLQQRFVPVKVDEQGGQHRFLAQAKYPVLIQFPKSRRLEQMVEHLPGAFQPRQLLLFLVL